MTKPEKTDAESQNERWDILSELEERLEVPMLVLSFVWLVLMIVEFTQGLSSFLQRLNDLIWILFIFDFSIKFIIAPKKIVFLKTHWLLLAALSLPALRLFRVFRAARILRSAGTLRGLRLARILSSTNRGIKALGKSLGRRGFGYVLALTILVNLTGAAGMLAFEREFGVLVDYGTTVWWTAMLLTTMGSDYFPKSAEGRLLCLLLATYGFAVFGYVTATVASFFVSRDAENAEGEIAGQQTVDQLRKEIQLLREDLRRLSMTSAK